LIDAQHREGVAKEIYRDQTLYHLTSTDSKRAIQRHGFSLRRKSGGATAELTDQATMSADFEHNAKTHHYAFTNSASAKEFQRNNFRSSGDPALVRFFRGNAPLERDPDFSNPAALRWGTDHPADHVLKSSSAPPTDGESRVMKRELRNRGIEASLQESGRLLRAVQSDSEDDF
jgi:type III effector protein AvrRpm1